MWYKESKRLKYYSKLKKYTIKLYNIHVTSSDKIRNKSVMLDLLSLLIMGHQFQSNKDPIFDTVSPFTTEYIKEYSPCLPTYSDAIVVLLRFNEIISNKYLKYYNKLLNISDNKNISPIITYTTTTVVTLYKSKNKRIVLSIPLFLHLVKLFNTTLGDHTNTIPNTDCLEKIWIVYKRYKMFSSGNNQASILPSLKLQLKELLNIKKELFGSPLNTSNIKFGSFFHDIDKYFGSMGNFFDIDITRGYYEINPVFDKCIISKVIDKILYSLDYANKHNNPLLFLLIIPYSYGTTFKEKVEEYLVFYNVYKDFKFVRFSRDYSETVISDISKTQIIVVATKYVNQYVKYNYSKIPELFAKNKSKIQT
jgi:hypothetical protein